MSHDFRNCTIHVIYHVIGWRCCSWCNVTFRRTSREFVPSSLLRFSVTAGCSYVCFLFFSFSLFFSFFFLPPAASFSSGWNILMAPWVSFSCSVVFNQQPQISYTMDGSMTPFRTCRLHAWYFHPAMMHDACLHCCGCGRLFYIINAEWITCDWLILSRVPGGYSAIESGLDSMQWYTEAHPRMPHLGGKMKKKKKKRRG